MDEHGLSCVWYSDLQVHLVKVGTGVRSRKTSDGRAGVDEVLLVCDLHLAGVHDKMSLRPVNFHRTFSPSALLWLVLRSWNTHRLLSNFL